jgi:hypothetical protein
MQRYVGAIDGKIASIPTILHQPSDGQGRHDRPRQDHDRQRLQNWATPATDYMVHQMFESGSAAASMSATNAPVCEIHKAGSILGLLPGGLCCSRRAIVRERPGLTCPTNHITESSSTAAERFHYTGHAAHVRARRSLWARRAPCVADRRCLRACRARACRAAPGRGCHSARAFP